MYSQLYLLTLTTLAYVNCARIGVRAPPTFVDKMVCYCFVQFICMIYYYADPKWALNHCTYQFLYMDRQLADTAALCILSTFCSQLIAVYRFLKQIN